MGASSFAPPPTDVSAIRLDDVTVAYGRQVILEGVTLTIPQGAFWAILGPNAAGKTTLLRTILGIVRPQRGRVEVFGRPPRRLGSWRVWIGYVPQQHTMTPVRFPLRAYDVVMMGRYRRIGLFRRPGPEDHRQAQAALAQVGMTHAAHKPWYALSGGERQRILLARALATRPRLLLLDEPTAGVDAAATRTLYEMLYELHRQGITVVVVSHDVGVISQYVDGVACLNRRLVTHGRPEEVLTRSTLESMYGCEVLFLHHGAVPHIVLHQHERDEDASAEGASAWNG